VESVLQERLAKEAARLGASCPPDRLAKLARYFDLLVFWNRKINLTAVRDPAEIVEKHFVDSLAVVPWIPFETVSLVDVGTGPGFPGAVIAVARPGIRVTLVESNHKKTAFLLTLIGELGLSNVIVKAQRAEDLKLAEDVAVSRATWDLLEWLSIGAGLVKPGGLVLGMEAAVQYVLPAGAERHPYELGDATRAVVTYRST
jgi:16S rRNA (guanine527-N7)-methyltransferase